MERTFKYGFWLTAFALFITALVLLKGILLPFVASLVLAYFLNPIVNFLQKKGFSRTIATLSLIVGFLLFLALAFAIIFPVLQHQVMVFADKVPTYASQIWLKVQPILEELKDAIPPEQVDNIKTSLSGYTANALKFIANFLMGILSGGVALFNIVSLLVITPVVAFYVLRDWESVQSFVESIVPVSSKKTFKEQFAIINDILSSFIRGQATVCICLAVFYGVGLSLTGLDIGILVGMATGILSFIPYVGCLTGFIVSMGLGLAQFTDYFQLLYIVAVFGIGQILEGYVLTPYLVGEKVGLHPVWVIFALLAGGYLLGFLGILIAVPVAAVIGVLARFWLGKYRKSSLYTSKKEEQCHIENAKVK